MNRTKENVFVGFRGTITLIVLLCSHATSLSQQTTYGYRVVGKPGYSAENRPPASATHGEGARPLPSTATWKPPATPLRIASTYIVTNTGDAGVGSFRRAIDSANTNPGLDLITFAIPGGGVQTIALLSALPTITGPVIIDGWTQPGFGGTPMIELRGDLAGTNINGLVLTGGNSKVRGLVINRFTGAGGGNGIGIALDESGGDTIEGNYIGTNSAGTAALPNTGAGIGIFGTSTHNLIGGTTPESRNVISGNGVGIETNDILGGGGGNVIRGNYIGVNAAGTLALGNAGNGIYLNTPHDTVGGEVAGARNVISGNGYPGIFMDVFDSGAVVQGNYVGTDFTGMLNLGNLQNGILVNEAPGNVIGDSIAAGRNVFSGNAFPGVYIFGATATGNIVRGNYVGTNAAGTGAMGNSNGIYIDNAPNNIIGGSATGARNIVSGNTFPGIFVSGAGATANRIVNNYIGTNAGGSAAIPNSAGIVIDNAPGNVIGGATPEEGNLVSGNMLYGIQIRNGATGNSVLSNFIGTDYSGTRALGNGWHGVIINSSQDTVSSNVIAYNHGSGVYDSTGTQNPILQNSMFSNTSLGIDLAPGGLARNDSLDGDEGPNHLQNFPLLDSATVSGGDVRVHGRLNSTPNAQFRLDFYQNTNYHPSHFGEGQFPLYPTLTVFTDAGGNAKFDTTISLFIIGGGNYIAATATDNAGNTSEFSQDLCLSDSDGDGILDSWETPGWGIDVNSDSTIDLDLSALGAQPNHKDVFVEVDAMTGFVPPDSALKMVVSSFKRVPNAYLHNPDGLPGINLHYVLDDTTIPVVNFPNIWSDFDNVKHIFFGTKAQRDSSNARYILQAKNLVYRYCIFARTYSTTDDTSSSGRAELVGGLGGNDFMVTFGAPPWNATKKLEDNAGTFMHELGHTLGLMHGGDQPKKNYKPNYYSVMNYLWQTNYSWQVPGSWSLNYSPVALPTLDETSLDETVGLNPPVGAYPIIAVPFTDSLVHAHFARLEPGVAVDWTGNGDSSSTSVNVDINGGGSSPNDTLTGYADWPNLKYNFRNSPAFAPGIHSSPRDVDEPEMKKQDYDYLNSLPPPKPYGTFLMDGQVDTSAPLLATNAGMNLYARYKSGRLYVATNSAQSQGADMFVFVSDAQYPLRAAPSGKNGQVAAWTVFLKNKSSDNSIGWYDAAEAPLTSITLDSAGSVLEGVVDIEMLYGRKPTNLYVAVGKYAAGVGGALLAQVPVGNGDGNIDPSEILQVVGTPPPPLPYFTQQGNKLVGSGAVNGSVGVQQGCSVALSSDGNTAIVGGDADNGYVGAAWVFTRTSGLWSQQGAKLVGSDAAGVARQGSSVALSSDGNTAVVGGFRDNNYVGAAWIFTRNGGVWTQQGPKLVGTGAVAFNELGWSVAISSDGNTAIIGSSGAGAWVFTRTGGVWTQQGTNLVGTGGVGTSGQGISVSLSSDGNTAIVGGYADNNYAGAAWIFTRSGGIWAQQGSKLVGTGAVNTPYAAYQGWAVAMSSDGNTAAMGGIQDDTARGAVWVFTRSGSTWVQQGGKLVGTGSVGHGEQGYSVSLSSDGSTALFGGYADDGSKGATWVFTRAAGIWSQQSNKLVGTGAVNTPYPALQGYSVALSSDGNTAMVGGPNDAQDLGAAWVFVHETPLPIQLASFTATIVNGSHVRLDWTTLSEINNYGFEAQRKPESTGEFQAVPNSFVPGHGTTNEPHTYACIDTTVPVGRWSYRLKQIDLDGTFHFGPAVTVNVVTGVNDTQTPKVFALYQNYPNPFNPSTTLRYDVPIATRVSLKVYDILGREVATLVDDVQQPGSKSVQFEAGRFASGVYFYRMAAGKFVATRRMVVVK